MYVHMVKGKFNINEVVATDRNPDPGLHGASHHYKPKATHVIKHRAKGHVRT